MRLGVDTDAVVNEGGFTSGQRRFLDFHRNANGARDPFYEAMREVAPGHLVFSFVDARIFAIGIAQSYCWESPKPAEFGSAGQNWENVGWRVAVHFSELGRRIRPKEHIRVLRPVLPDKYSPLTPSGNGLQSVYLTELPTRLAEVLAGLIGPEAAGLIGAAGTPRQRGRRYTSNARSISSAGVDVERDFALIGTDLHGTPLIGKGEPNT
jgi:hypothetical protein